jgi:drug/metabolite transporter (DMT)-like permease
LVEFPRRPIIDGRGMTVSGAQAVSKLGFPIGALCVLAAGLTWSFTGIFPRLAPDLNSCQFLTWRSLGVASAFAVILRSEGRCDGRRLRDILAAVVWMAATGAGPPMARAAK